MTTLNYTENAYTARLEQWHDSMETRLRAEDGWLTVVGLDWLHEGENTVGSAADSDITLPNANIPAQVGTIHFHDTRATLTVTTEAPVLVNGEAVKSADLNDDHAEGGPTRVQVGSITFFVIKRGDQYGIRIRDTQSEARQAFTGRVWFPIDEAYRVRARFVPHADQHQIEIENVIGQIERFSNPGRVEFDLHGQTLSLEAFDGGPDQLWIVFRDATSGVSTYGASRFLYAPLAADGTVDLDFNQAYNPPCAFTHYATCPLPPRENRLTVAIEAGEQVAK